MQGKRKNGGIERDDAGRMQQETTSPDAMVLYKERL
jgi:hypothetical protein